VRSSWHSSKRRRPPIKPRYCRDRLASYKVPRVWRFVEQFPQTASGKFQKFVLREQYLAEED
jgi:acyl-CoA synthetase (AMP-forming)/AMP-acid ligase II